MDTRGVCVRVQSVTRVVEKTRKHTRPPSPPLPPRCILPSRGRRIRPSCAWSARRSCTDCICSLQEGMRGAARWRGGTVSHRNRTTRPLASGGELKAGLEGRAARQRPRREEGVTFLVVADGVDPRDAAGRAAALAAALARVGAGALGLDLVVEVVEARVGREHGALKGRRVRIEAKARGSRSHAKCGKELAHRGAGKAQRRQGGARGGRVGVVGRRGEPGGDGQHSRSATARAAWSPRAPRGGSTPAFPRATPRTCRARPCNSGRRARRRQAARAAPRTQKATSVPWLPWAASCLAVHTRSMNEAHWQFQEVHTQGRKFQNVAIFLRKLRAHAQAQLPKAYGRLRQSASRPAAASWERLEQSCWRRCQCQW